MDSKIPGTLLWSRRWTGGGASTVGCFCQRLHLTADNRSSSTPFIPARPWQCSRKRADTLGWTRPTRPGVSVGPSCECAGCSDGQLGGLPRLERGPGCMSLMRDRTTKEPFFCTLGSGSGTHRAVANGWNGRARGHRHRRVQPACLRPPSLLPTLTSSFFASVVPQMAKEVELRARCRCIVSWSLFGQKVFFKHKVAAPPMMRQTLHQALVAALKVTDKGLPGTIVAGCVCGAAIESERFFCPCCWEFSRSSSPTPPTEHMRREITLSLFRMRGPSPTTEKGKWLTPRHMQ